MAPSLTPDRVRLHFPPAEEDWQFPAAESGGALLNAIADALLPPTSLAVLALVLVLTAGRWRKLGVLVLVAFAAAVHALGFVRASEQPGAAGRRARAGARGDRDPVGGGDPRAGPVRSRAGRAYAGPAAGRRRTLSATAFADPCVGRPGHAPCQNVARGDDGPKPGTGFRRPGPLARGPVVRHLAECRIQRGDSAQARGSPGSIW